MYYTIMQLKAIAKERGVKLKTNASKKEICERPDIKLTANLVYPTKGTCKAIRIINQDTNDTIEFQSIYNLAKTLKVNMGMIYSRMRGNKAIAVVDPVTMWKSDNTTIGAGEYKLELV